MAKSKLIIILNSVILIILIELILFFLFTNKYKDNEINKLKFLENFHISKLYVKKKLLDKNLINKEYSKNKKIYYQISNKYQHKVIELDDLLGWRLKKNTIKFKSNIFSKDVGFFIHNSNGLAVDPRWPIAGSAPPSRMSRDCLASNPIDIESRLHCS